MNNKYNAEQMNIIFDKYMHFVDDLPYKYTDSIKSLLYIIIPAFVIKYGLENEKAILNTFSNVKIFITDEKNNIIQAFFKNILFKKADKIFVDKFIVLQNYDEKNPLNILDNLVHEFNHALNSENKQISYQEKFIYLRTGISYFKYNFDNLEFISKDNNYILEEVLNTSESEDIINIIHSFKKYKFDNKKINTFLYYIDNHIINKYKSDAYQLEMYFLREIMQNKFFTSTLSNLRIKGNTEDIEYWFNNIIGFEDAYKKFNDIIIKVSELGQSEPKSFFAKRKWKKTINDLYKEMLNITLAFNKNSNYK